MSRRLENFQAMIAKGAKDPFVHYALAMELRSLDRLDEALAAFDGVIRDFPDYVPTYLMAAQVAEKLGRPEVARNCAERGVSAAKRAGDAKARGELESLLASLD